MELFYNKNSHSGCIKLNGRDSFNMTNKFTVIMQPIPLKTCNMFNAIQIVFNIMQEKNNAILLYVFFFKKSSLKHL